MTLISHKYKFIFLRTMKTASSSIENFFRKYCLHDENNYYNTLMYKNEVISSAGIVGMEGSWNYMRKTGQKWAINC